MSIILLHREFSEERIASAVEKAADAQAWNAESVKQLVLSIFEATTPAFPLPSELIPDAMDMAFEEADIGRYNKLLEGALL